MKNQKKIGTLVFAIVFALGVNAKITITRTNGGANGYKTVSETHDGNNHTLNCFDPGNEACKFILSTTIANPQQIDAIEVAVDQAIDTGDYSGTGNLVGTNLWYCWTYSNGIRRYTINENSPDCN
jgi:hypothetical protein